MTAPDKVKQLILFRALNIIYTSPEAINAKWNEIGSDFYLITDKINEVRNSIEAIDTDIPPYRHGNYKSQSVAMPMLDGSWVGWTNYYNCGKYSHPELIDWIEHAYDLDCEVVMKPEFVFKKKESVNE